MVRIGLHVESSGVEQLYATSFRAHQTFAAHVVQDADDNLAYRPDRTRQLILAGPGDQLSAHLLFCRQVEQMPGEALADCGEGARLYLADVLRYPCAGLAEQRSHHANVSLG